MRRLICCSLLLLAFVVSRLVELPAQDAAVARPKPLKALLILGGGCHDYAKQKDILKKGIEARVMAEVVIVYSPDKSTTARFDIYDNPDWAKGCDIVIHDECSADVKELPYVQNILNAHKSGVPAINLHCAMHCYRTGTDDWFEFLGMPSSSHGPQKPIDIAFVDREHPIVKGFGGAGGAYAKPLENWTPINETRAEQTSLIVLAPPSLMAFHDDNGGGVRVSHHTETVVNWIGFDHLNTRRIDCEGATFSSSDHFDDAPPDRNRSIQH